MTLRPARKHLALPVLLVLAAVLALGAAWVTRPPVQRSFAFGRFGTVKVLYRDLDARHVAIISSDDPGARRLVDMLTGHDTLVILTSARDLAAGLEADGGDCTQFGYDFEALSQYTQKTLGRDAYVKPVLIGEGPGAALIVAGANQSQPGSFAALFAGHFCPRSPLRLPLCPSDRLTLDEHGVYQPSPAMASPLKIMSVAPDCGPQAGRFVAGTPAAQSIAGNTKSLTRWTDAFEEFVDGQGGGVPKSLADLPLVLVPANGDQPAARDRFAIFLSGDGGWVGLDRTVAARLAAQGMPVLGLDSLRFFWKARSPEEVAATLKRIIDTFGAASGRHHAVLVGYSFGADVLPWSTRALDPATRARVDAVALIGAGTTADFEFHIGSWLSDAPQGQDAKDNVAAFAPPGLDRPVICLYGSDEAADSLCPKLPAPAQAVARPGGHHFDEDYDSLAQAILDRLP